MKKVLCFLVCFIMILGTLPVSAAGSADILGYGSFETKSTGIYSSSMRKTGYSEDYAHTGNTSIKVEGGYEHRWALMWFSAKLENHTKYHFSCYVYSTGEVSTISATAYYTVNGTRKTVSIGQSGSFGGAVPNGKWTRYEGNFEINETAGDISGTGIELNVQGVCDTYIDDMEISKGYQDIFEEEWNDEVPEKIEIKGDTLNLYVSQDAADGGDGSKEKPFNSLFAARDYVRTINKNMKQNIAVNIMGGFYGLTETFKLTEEDSGSNGYYIIWRAAEGEDVTISGGRKVTGWEESEIPGVYKAHNVGDNVRNIYVNNKLATRAKVEDYIVPLSWYNDETDATSTNDGVIIPKGIIKNPEAATNLEVFRLVTFNGNWAVKGKAMDSEEGTIIAFKQPAYMYHEKSGVGILAWRVTDDFRLENALEFLDKPGEWYQDIDTDTLYYMPREGENIFESEVVSPLIENVVEIKGESIDNRAKNIVFSGLTFAHGGNDYTSNKGRTVHQSTSLWTFEESAGYQTQWHVEAGNINLENASNVLFEKNTVKHMSSLGIRMLAGVENCEINGNAFYEMANAAINIGAATHNPVLDKDMLPRNVTISNNILTEIAHEYPTSGALQVYFANGIYILNNEVYNTYYSGICTGWSWNDATVPQRRYNIIGNRIWNTNKFGQDGAPIYTLGAIPKSTLQYNYISFVPDEHLRPQIYHDNGSAHWYDYRNVVFTGDMAGTGNWISPYCQYQHDLVLVENYTSNEKRSYVAEDTIETKTGINPDGSWSEAARYAISQSGLSDGYEYLYDMVPNYGEQSRLKNVTLQTKEQDNANPVQLTTGNSVTLRALFERYNGNLYFEDTFESVASTDTSVLQCNGNKVTAVGSGVATINAITNDGHHISIIMTVDDHAESLKMIATTDELKVGDVSYLKYVLETKYWSHTILPHEFKSSNPHIVSVDDMGTVRALRNGQAKITLKVTFNGQEYEDSIDVMVKDASVAANLSLDEHIYEINSDKNLKASVALGEKTTVVSSNNGAAKFENAAGATVSQEIVDTYTAEMRRLFSIDVLDDSYNPKDNLTEEQFVSLVEKATKRSREDFHVQIKEGYITRERMAYVLSQALKYVWGNTFVGSTRLTNISDREEISPEMVPYVSNVVKYELFYITESVPQFRPKDLGTVAEASAAIFRMLYPKEILNAEYPDGWFNRAYEGEAMGRNAHSIIRTDENKALASGSNSLGSEGIGIPAASGNYTVNLKTNFNNEILEKNDFCFVYDKNNLFKSDDMKVADIGKESSSVVLNEDGKIRVITKSGNVWDNEDSHTFIYKEVSDENYEVSTTIESMTNTHQDAASGIFVRSSNDAGSIKIDYRIKTGGQTFLCWRTAEGGATSFTSGKTLPFPASLRLVKNGSTYTAYYKDGDKWIEDMKYTVNGLDGKVHVGISQYAMTNASGIPCSSIFTDLYIGAERDLENVIRKEEVQKPAAENKPVADEEKKEEEKTEITIDRNRHLDIFPNGGFERGISGWGVGGGTIAVSGEAYSGNKAMVFEPSDAAGYPTFTIPELKSNKTYYMIFRAKTKSGEASFSPYIQYNNGKTWVKADCIYHTDMKANAEEWKEFIVEYKINEPFSGNQLIFYTVAGSEVYIDSFEMLYK